MPAEGRFVRNASSSRTFTRVFPHVYTTCTQGKLWDKARALAQTSAPQLASYVEQVFVNAMMDRVCTPPSLRSLSSSRR